MSISEVLASEICLRILTYSGPLVLVIAIWTVTVVTVKRKRFSIGRPLVIRRKIGGLTFPQYGARNSSKILKTAENNAVELQSVKAETTNEADDVSSILEHFDYKDNDAMMKEDASEIKSTDQEDNDEKTSEIVPETETDNKLEIDDSYLKNGEDDIASEMKPDEKVSEIDTETEAKNTVEETQVELPVEETIAEIVVSSATEESNTEKLSSFVNADKMNLESPVTDSGIDELDVTEAKVLKSSDEALTLKIFDNASEESDDVLQSPTELVESPQEIFSIPFVLESPINVSYPDSLPFKDSITKGDEVPNSNVQEPEDATKVESKCNTAPSELQSKAVKQSIFEEEPETPIEKKEEEKEISPEEREEKIQKANLKFELELALQMMGKRKTKSEDYRSQSHTVQKSNKIKPIEKGSNSLTLPLNLSFPESSTGTTLGNNLKSKVGLMKDRQKQTKASATLTSNYTFEIQNEE